MTSLNILCSDHHNFNVLKEIAKKNKERETQRFFLWPIKHFQKYFMAHQYMLIIFYGPCKNPPAPTPT